MSDDPYSQVPPPPPPMDAAPPPPPPPGYTPPPPPAGGGPVSENRQIWLVLSYLGLLALLPYLIEKEDREVQWHAKHGLVICGAEIILGLVLGVVLTLINMVTGCLGCLVGPLIVIPMLIFHVMLIVKALNGERLLIPGISQYADQF
jgi:uncharacterized membrane protein